MFWQDSDEAQVTFHEASAYFPEEEWQLLHKWQKELYRNVMKEIHQALISLGPLIATTVLSLIAKEKDGLIPMDKQHSGKTQMFHHSPSDPDVLFRIHEAENQYISTAEDSERKEKKDWINTGFPFFNNGGKEEEPISILIDHLGEEVHNINANTSTGHKAVQFSIKEEDVTCCVDQQDSEIIENISSPEGDGFMRRKWKVEDIMKVDEKIQAPKDVSENAKISVQQTFENGISSKSFLWSERFEQSENNKMPRTKEVINNVHSNLYDGHCNTDQPNLNIESDRHFSNAAQVTCLQNAPQMLRQFVGNNTEQHLCHKKDVFDNQKSRVTERIYHCSECNKCFTRKQHFIGHQRIHTGERPYQCTECEKSFSHTHHLARHRRIHFGEKPYQCTECGKRFNRKDNLMGHQRVHKGERPY